MTPFPRSRCYRLFSQQNYIRIYNTCHPYFHLKNKYFYEIITKIATRRLLFLKFAPLFTVEDGNHLYQPFRFIHFQSSSHWYSERSMDECASVDRCVFDGIRYIRHTSASAEIYTHEDESTRRWCQNGADIERHLMPFDLPKITCVFCIYLT